MDEDEFNRSIEPILSKKGKVYTAEPDRDPNDINPHLKVKSAPCVGWLFQSETTEERIKSVQLSYYFGKLVPYCNLFVDHDCKLIRLHEYLEVAACALIHHPPEHLPACLYEWLCLKLIVWPLTCLTRQVGFEDVIAEPISTHSFDRVWIGSHAAFELVKFIFYRLLTTLLAVPMAFILGVVFAVLSCVHIW